MFRRLVIIFICVVAIAFIANKLPARNRQLKLKIAVSALGESGFRFADVSAVAPDFTLLADPFWDGTRFVLWGADGKCSTFNDNRSQVKVLTLNPGPSIKRWPSPKRMPLEPEFRS